MTAARALRELTAPVEDYLKTIYELVAVGGDATTNEIAAALHIAAPSVSGMLRRLAGQGLVTHEPYKGVQLTRNGRRAALRTIRRHRVIESYLTQALGYPWDRVHDEAERLEHSASDELIDRMATAIGEPATDPHGAPIPTRDGTLTAEPVLETLAELGPGDPARIARVSDRDGERLRYLATLGITIGTLVEVVSREPYDGPIAIRIGARRRVIGPELARHILVTPIGTKRHSRRG
jgi:DtxR family transcriptional regulator, Mn-dependent transcriptional regulator